MSDTLVVIPAYNESNNIARVFQELQSDLPGFDLLVINDGSSDATLSVLHRLGVRHLNIPFNMGYSAALQSGFKYAVANGYAHVIQFDGDGQHIAGQARRLVEAMEESGADIVIGSRFKSPPGYRSPFFRRLGTGIFRLLIRWICRVEISDPTSGFQMLNRRVFEHYARSCNYPVFPDANLVIEMLLAGYVIREVGVEMRPRHSGRSMHSGLVRPAKYMIKVVFSIAMIFSKYLFSKRARRTEP